MTVFDWVSQQPTWFVGVITLVIYLSGAGITFGVLNALGVIDDRTLDGWSHLMVFAWPVTWALVVLLAPAAALGVGAYWVTRGAQRLVMGKKG